MIEFIGYLASFCFAVCALPQSYQSWKQGHSRGVSGLFIGTWFSGEVLMIVYVVLGPIGWDWPIMLNLMANLVFGSPIIYYMFFPREEKHDSSN